MKLIVITDLLIVTTFNIFFQFSKKYNNKNSTIFNIHFP